MEWLRTSRLHLRKPERFASSLLHLVHSVETLHEGCCVLCRPADHQDCVVTTDRARDLGHSRTIDRDRERLRLAWIGLQYDQLLDALLRPQVFLDGSLQGRLRIAADRLGSGAAIGAVDRPLHEPELANIAGHRGLGGFDAAGAKTLPQLLLTGNGFLLNQFEDCGLPVRLHHHVVTNEYTRLYRQTATAMMFFLTLRASRLYNYRFR